MFYKVLSKLLDYPSDEMLEALPEMQQAIRRGFEAAEWLVLDRFFKHLQGLSARDAQAAYVLTFDFAPEHSLHLTHHLFGDDKNRGPALIDLGEFYREFGFEIRQAANDEGSNEIPDFLPLMLEFSSQLSEEEAHFFLSQWSRVLDQLAQNLEKTDSPYAPLIRLVEKRSQLIQAAA